MEKGFVLFAIAMSMVVLLTACGGSSRNNSLEGTWLQVEYYISFEDNHSSILEEVVFEEQDVEIEEEPQVESKESISTIPEVEPINLQEIEDSIAGGIPVPELRFIEREITFTENQITYEGHVAIYELSEDGEHVVIDSGFFQGSHRFVIDGSTLTFAGSTWHKVGSNPYNEHRESVTTSGEEELARLTRERENQIADEVQAIINEHIAEEERTIRIASMVGEAESALADLENAIEKVEVEIHEQVLTWLAGDWRQHFEGRRPNSFFTDDITFEKDGSFSHQVEINQIGVFVATDDRWDEFGYVEITTRNIRGIDAEMFRANLVLSVEQYNAVDSALHESTIATIRSEIAHLENYEMINVGDYLESITLINRVGNVVFRISTASFGRDYFSVDGGRNDTHIRDDIYLFERR